ncbi:helix-turn-helix domain-containing protein [Saccharothrix sp. NRRL B-16348]|uniref:helix-turn-helix domain-containing protein n=1 Tax=Saccharothrix sp. NRRL B-16348 TaxID=1415542 RepID=UPI001E5BB8D9|nr:helix-turn-helix transcriptional regulator [Saccharothrix sp. NRRL B-16348]
MGPIEQRSPILQAFGATVRQIREQSGLSQETLADRADLHRTYVSSIERGERNIGLINIVALAEALDVKPGLLLADLPVLRSYSKGENE